MASETSPTHATTEAAGHASGGGLPGLPGGMKLHF
jgi:hypothetical protein